MTFIDGWMFNDRHSYLIGGKISFILSLCDFITIDITKC